MGSVPRSPRAAPAPARRPSRLHGIVIRRLDALVRQIDPARRGDVVGVHQARVASRRLRELTAVLAWAAPPVHRTELDRLRRRLRRTTRALGSVRELDVTAQLASELEQTAPSWRGITTRISDRLDAERPRARRRLSARLDALDLDGGVQTLMAAADAAADRRLSHGLAARIVRRARELGDAIVRAGGLYTPERLHAVRIAAKKLRYVLEIASERGLTRARGAVTRIKLFQELLGRLHDLEVAIARARALPPAAGRRDAGDAEISRFTSAVEDQVRLLHGQYLSQRAALDDVVHRCLEEFGPSLAQRRARRSGRSSRRAAAGAH